MGFWSRLLALFGGGNTSPEGLTQKGRNLAAKENYMGAVEFYKKALAEDPYHVPAYDGMGKAFFRLGMREEAEREFAIADGLEKLSTNPYDTESAIKMARAMMAKGIHKHAVPFLEPLIEKNPRNPELLKSMGLSYKAAGNDKKAREIFKLGIERIPRDADFYQHLGNIELRSGNKAEGEKLVNLARFMAQAYSNPGDHEARFQLAKLFFNRELFGEAAEFLRQAVAIYRNNVDYWLLLGQAYQRANQLPAAADTLKQAVKIAPSDSRPPKLLAQVYQFMGRFDDSRAARQVAQVLEAGQSDNKTPQQGAQFVKYLLSIGNNDEARTQLGQMLEKWPDSLELRFITGHLAVKDGQFDDAIQELKSVASEKEDWAEPHIWLAIAYQRIGDNMSALAEGQLATRLAPKSHTIHKLFGDILRDQKKFGMAENAYETAENLRTLKRAKKIPTEDGEEIEEIK